MPVPHSGARLQPWSCLRYRPQFPHKSAISQAPFIVQQVRRRTSQLINWFNNLGSPADLKRRLSSFASPKPPQRCPAPLSLSILSTNSCSRTDIRMFDPDTTTEDLASQSVTCLQALGDHASTVHPSTPPFAARRSTRCVSSSSCLYQLPCRPAALTTHEPPFASSTRQASHCSLCRQFAPGHPRLRVHRETEIIKA